MLGAGGRRALNISGIKQSRVRLLESLQPKLTFRGWREEEELVAAQAAGSAEQVLTLSDSGALRVLAAKLAAQGNRRCAHSALSPHSAAEAEAVAVAVFERQYARLLTELAQERTDFCDGSGIRTHAAETHS